MSKFRIVSLCPSTTYTLFDLGLGKNIVGRTLFCSEPKEAHLIKKVGGTKNPNLEKIKALNPTHIMFNKEENDISHLFDLEQIAPVIETTPLTYDDMLESILIIGEKFSKQPQANELLSQLNSIRKEILTKNYKSFRYLYLIWQNPIMSISDNTFIHHILSLFNGHNALTTTYKNRYPELKENDLRNLKHDILFLSSEPFPFKRSHLEQYRYAKGKPYLINGQNTSWHGSYMVEGLRKLSLYFDALQHEL